MKRILASILLFIGPAIGLAQTSYPMITHLTPVAIQRGQSVELVVEGQMNFWGAHQIIVHGNGVSGEIIRPAGSDLKSEAMPTTPVRSIKVKLTAKPDAPLGVREFRIATRLGISSIGQLLIVDDPVVGESAKNNTIVDAMPLSLPCVVSGKIEAVEDVDCYRIKAKRGQTITAEVHCARIQDKIHDLQKHADPLVSIVDANGREFASNDDFYFADPYLTFAVPEDGEYIVQVRDAKYDGDPRWVYALALTDRPAVSHIFPMAFSPGQMSTVEPVGGAKSVAGPATIDAPKTPGLHTARVRIGEAWTNPTAMIVTSLPLQTEQEPNNEREQATKLTIPAGVNGRIGQARDLDYYRISAKKGMPLRIEISARRFGTALQSGLDSVVDVLTLDGKLLISNDDLNGKDAGLTYTPTADGDLLIRVRDLNSKGGPTSPYFLAIEPAQPDFTVKVDPAKAMIGPGSSAAWYVIATRANGFTGPIRIDVKGLPPGVSVNPLTLEPSMTQGTLVFTAGKDAPLGLGTIEITGTATAMIDGKETTLTRDVIGMDEIYLPGGGRGRFDIDMKALAVTDGSDIAEVKVEPANITLKPGQEITLKVTITRRPNFKGNVNLDVILRHLGGTFANPLPPGVTMVDAKSKTLIPANATQGHITLKAAPDAPPIKNVPICVMANVSVNFVVKISHTSPALLLSVEK